MGKRRFGMVDIAITRCCNMKCKFCTATATHGYDKMMSLYEFKLYLDRIDSLISEQKINMPSKFISYGNVGEPLMNPHFIEMNQYAKKRGWKSGIYTNGVLLTKEKIEQIYAMGGIDTVNVSVTGIKSEIYKDFQGYGFSRREQEKLLQLVLKNIENVVRVRNEKHKDTKIAVNYIITKKTLLHIIPYVKYMAKIGIDEIRFTPLIDRPRGRKNIKVKCNRLDYILNVDEKGDISACNNDFLKRNVTGNLLQDNWFDCYEALVCNMNNNDLDNLPEVCQICDRTNFTSFWDYMSMNFHGYLNFQNHKIMWKSSLDAYIKSLWVKVKWYLAERY